MIELDLPQTKAVERALLLDGFGIFHQPRVGKTRVAITIVNRRKPQRLLVVCPKGTFSTTWVGAFKQLDPSIEAVMYNYEAVINRKTKAKLRRWLRKATSMVILDEAHRIKRRSSKQSRACRSLGACADWRVAMTGTPIANGIWDAWAIYDFLDTKIFGKWKHFAARYLEKGGFQNRQIVGVRNLQEFTRIFHDHCDRVELNDVADRKLKIRRRTQYIQLNSVAREHYDELERELVTATKKLRVEARLVITLTLRLQQICGGFLSNGEEIEQIDSGKLDVVSEVLASRRNAATVICATYLPEILAIKRRATKLKIPITEIRGGKPLEKPFTEGVAIIQQRSGEGIDLSAADLLMFYSWNYSYINYEQMRFRVLSRQRTRVDYLFLKAENTVDDLIYQAVVEKRRLSDIVCDHYRRNR